MSRSHPHSISLRVPRFVDQSLGAAASAVSVPYAPLVEGAAQTPDPGAAPGLYPEVPWPAEDVFFGWGRARLPAVGVRLPAEDPAIWPRVPARQPGQGVTLPASDPSPVPVHPARLPGVGVGWPSRLG